MRERSDNAVLTSEQVLLSTCMPVEVPGMNEKAVFTTVEGLRGWCKTVYVWERLDNAVFTSEEVL